MRRLTWSYAAGVILALFAGCVMDSALLPEDGKQEEILNLPRLPGAQGSRPGQATGEPSGVYQTDNSNSNGGNSNANDNGNGNGGNANDNGNANGGNVNADDNSNVNGGNANDNANVNGGNGNVNENGNSNVNGNGNDNGGGGPCPDGSFRVSTELSGTGAGEAEYRLLPGGCERFRVRVEGTLAGRTLDVIVDSVVVGQIVTDSRGRGELELDSEDGTWPAGFPQVDIGDVVQVGAVLSGTFALDCSADPNSCNGNANGNGNVNGGNVNGGNVNG